MYKFVALLLFLSACEQFPQTEVSNRKNLNPKNLELISQPIDDFLPDPPMIENEEDDDLEPVINSKFRTKVSLSTTKDMLLINVLARLAESAGVNIIIAPEIEGSIACSAKNRPFIDILQDICESAGLKYTINNDCVKIEYDSPILRTYNIQFLNIQRDMTSSIATSTDIFTDQMSADINSASNNSAKADNGSTSVVTGTVKNNFWDELVTNLTQMVGDDGQISVHKQGGLVTVYAPQRRQNAVKKYLKLLKQSIESQVLIEAKILEVTLGDEFRGGINWNILRNGGAKFKYGTADQSEMFSFGIDRANLSILAGIIEKFGAVKTLSNPRITVLNNQSAVLKVAKNEVIYIPSLQKQYATNLNNNNFDFMSTTLHTIPIGLIMSVVPSIDRRTNSVLLDLRPTISRVVEYKKVPFFYQSGTNSQNNHMTQEIPIVDVREFDSVIRLNSGQVAVMGGLMQEESHNRREGLPRASELDFAFGSRQKSTKVTELVIFLKATILHKRAYHAADEKLYKSFANDARPLNFNGKTITKKSDR